MTFSAAASVPPVGRSRRCAAAWAGWGIALLLSALVSAESAAQPGNRPGARPGARAREDLYIVPVRREFLVDRVRRTALVFVPHAAQETPAPVVFVFHGHGGTMQQSAESFGFHQLWREAIVVYPQGLNTPSDGDPQGTKPGWSTSAPYKTNRDVRFFDQILEALQREYKVDPARIYATGTSNGGFFTYTLWASRSDVLAAVAPSSCHMRRLDAQDQLTPKPVFVVGGEKDPLVTIQSQREAIEELRRLNGCEGEGVPGRNPVIHTYRSRAGTPVVTYLHPGGHPYPKAATEPIVEFFKRNPRRTEAP